MSDIVRTNKYHRTIFNLADVDGEEIECTVDFYSVVDACDVKCPARAHAIKKLLCAGLRGKNDELADLKESMQAIERSIQNLERRMSRDRRVHRASLSSGMIDAE